MDINLYHAACNDCAFFEDHGTEREHTDDGGHCRFNPPVTQPVPTSADCGQSLRRMTGAVILRPNIASSDDCRRQHYYSGFTYRAMRRGMTAGNA